MHKKFRIFIFIAAIILLANELSGQKSEKPPSINCPSEKMEVHLSRESVFAGEILWFKIYCTSSVFPGEELSSIAFIELVSSENNSILRKKILLKNGGGSGEFEIPNNLATGLYYILSYTNWMKNFGEGSFFRKDIAIINPDQPYISSVHDLDSLRKFESRTDAGFTSGNLKIIPDRKKYSLRKPVTIKIETTRPLTDYSVSVTREEPQMIFATQTNNETVPAISPDNFSYLPDYKGIRMSGKLTDQSGNPVSGALVRVSAPGPGTDLKGSTTDDSGVFNFLLKPKMGEQEMVVTLPADDEKISLEESFWNGFREPPHNQAFSLDPEAVSYLKDKFINLQFQSRFNNISSIKNVQTRKEVDSSVFYSKPDQLIEFKNYIDLDSLREYIYELVPSVKFSRKNEGSEIMVFNPVSMSYLDEEPGVFIDGVLYNNFADIAKIPVRDIDRMAIIPAVYYYKNFTFGGIIDIHTKKSDFNSVTLLPDMDRFIYPMADENDWKFTSPDYSTAGQENRIPDFRYLLFWEPHGRSEKTGESMVKFWTGDVKGKFIVKVVGISDDGEILHAENEIDIDD